MEAVVILVCERFGGIHTSNPVSMLKGVEVLKAIFKSTEEMGDERAYALKMKSGDARDRKSLKLKRRTMKKCMVLGPGTGWTFFIVLSKSLMKLLVIRDLPLHEMTEMTLCNLLSEKRG